MIRNLFIAVCLLPMMASAQQTLHIEGHLSDTRNDTLILSYPGIHEYHRIVMDNGRFTVEIPLNEPGEVQLMENYISNGYMRRQITLYGLPGECVTIHGTFTDYQVGGTPYYQQLNEVLSMERPYKQEEQRNIVWGSVMRSDNRLNQEEISKQFHQKRSDILNRLEDASVNFMVNHPSYDPAVLLLKNIRDAHKASKAYNAMKEEVRKGRMAPYCEPYVSRFTTEIARQKVAESIRPGKAAPLFTLYDIHGNPLSLKSLRGKYVVLDFWGSWCFWCLNGVPQMKAYYDKYRGKFEILGIDCNDTEEKWKAAVEKNQMNWLHVFNAKSDNIPQQYAVSGYPTKVIINPNGTINQVFVGEKEEFYEYLDQLFRTK